MTSETIEHSFREKVSAEINLLQEGLNRYRVFTPFQFEDGDHLVIVLKQMGQRWTLTDEGHTFMHLSYDLEWQDLLKGTRQKIISNALSVFGVEDREGELLLPIPQEQFGDALYSFVQALLKITDVTYLSRERVRSTFLEDFRALICSSVPPNRLTFNWHDPVNDSPGSYIVDCRINGMARPIDIFALSNDDRTRDATITLLKFEGWNVNHHSVGIFEDQERISRKVLARLTDVCEKQFSSIGGNEERIRKFLGENLN